MTITFDNLVDITSAADIPSFLVRELERSNYRRLGEDDNEIVTLLDPKDSQRVIRVSVGQSCCYEDYYLGYLRWAKDRASISVPKIYNLHTYKFDGDTHFIAEMEHFTLPITSEEDVWNDDNLASLCCLWDDTIGATGDVFPDALRHILFRHYAVVLNLNPEKISEDDWDVIHNHIIKVSRETNNDFAQILRKIMDGGVADCAFHEFQFNLGSIAVRPKTFELVLVSTT